ncbi:uncharacterized protein CC84DRAFT_808854 [Paraphaeosphaeria sporulosa]|uniref:RING-type domain-containing protein n=1 Tax=Paraphaeosphaeria sporulosa TaxID=1460663 RepID=A0A177CDU7_9PLEO|nr:uncharacterized protein CC84DRAFT_808854 [Paraphaeosphaeria sporulosa]OAG04900.1 hypothetical protein CC84DRAFT_808854 [Paraphaeosphaeria sporulosa]
MPSPPTLSSQCPARSVLTPSTLISNNHTRFDEEGRVDEVAGTPNDVGHPYPGFNLPSYSGPPDHPNLQWPQQLPRNFARHPQRTVPMTSSFSSDMFGTDTTVDETRNPQYHRNSEIPHPDVTSRRNPSYQRPHRQGSSDFNSPDRRHSSRSADGHAPLSELGSSLRTHNRRSFDRYSTDVPNGATGPNGPIRSPSSRGADRMAARRQRPIGHPLFRRMSSHMEHPNVPSTEQLRELREKLRHLLPAELPEGIDAMCDICQKDYSTKHVDPSEYDEVAIQLPCKHVFGEHCIHTWFDTCKKHKNKITCPMCRKVLIEPRCRENAQSRGQLLERLDRLRRQGDGGPFFEHMPRAIFEGRVAREP